MKEALAIIRTWFIDLNKTIKSGLNEVKGAVTSQEYPKNVSVDNLKDLSEPFSNGLNEIVKTLKEEINKIDKDIKVNVKNDLPNLYKLFKQDKDKIDLIKAINGLGKLIPTIPEGKDYEVNIKAITLALGDVIKAIENNKPELNIDLTEIENKLDDLLNKEFKIPIRDNKVSVILDKEQYKNLYNASVSSTSNGTMERLDTLNNKVSTSEKQDEVIKNTNLTKGGLFAEVLTLTNANTAYAVPSTAQTKNAEMVLYNPTDTTIYLKSLTGTTGGLPIAPDGKLTINLDANVQYYVYCSEAGKTLNVEMFKLET